MNYTDIFEGVQAEIEANQLIVEKLKDKIKLVDEGNRYCSKLLGAIHTEKPSAMGSIGSNVLQSQQFKDLKDVLHSLMAETRQYPYYKYNGLWFNALQTSINIVLMSSWLSNGHQLVNPQRVAEVLELRVENKDTNSGFDFTFEEYLHAAITMINELSRLAVNSVTATAAVNASGGSETYDLPVEIDRFLKEIQAGFMSLNLKNDSLRRRSDSIKYDVKKVEEIVYDLALRGLITINLKQ